MNIRQPSKKKEFPVTIETPHLILRELESSDFQPLFDMTTKPGFKYYYFNGTPKKVTAFLQIALDMRATAKDGKREEFLLGVVLKETGALIGHVGLHRADYIKEYNFQEGCFIDPSHQNKGYGREAMVNMKKFGYEELGLPGYTSMTHPDNKTSLHIFLSEGYTKMGDISIETIFRTEPRILLRQDKKEFYARRLLDKEPLILND
ncbi:MAG: GNAT family N-acetyltransferase [Alphaproteobacteria bacterium]|nr:GNAT family N-acetyltransferase [Alphaproteobacteria bacterium]